MQNYKNTVQDLDGAVAVGASVLVNLGGTVTAATIYSDDGVTAAANPLTTDANGQFTFWAAPGLYDLVISGSTFPTRYWNGIQLYDMVATGAPWFDVTDTAYGAVADGATDSSAGIQAAIDACEAAGGGVVFLPPGHYRVGSAMTIETSGVIVRGSGCGAEGSTAYGTVLSPLIGAAAFGPVFTIGVAGTTTYGSGIESLSLWCGSEGGADSAYTLNGMVKLLNCRECFIKNCRVDLRYPDADARIAIHIDASGTLSSTSNRIIGCHIQGGKRRAAATACYGYGLVISENSTGFNTSNEISNCKFYIEGNGSGKFVEIRAGVTGGNKFSDCQFDCATNEGINILGGDGTTFTNCVLDGAGGEMLSIAEGSKYNYFQGSIDGYVVDSNSNPNTRATIVQSDNRNGPSFPAINLQPRTAAPYYPGGTPAGIEINEGTIYYNSTAQAPYICTTGGPLATAAWTQIQLVGGVASGGVYPVDSYGAVPNDGTDDYAAIQAAIDACEAAGVGGDIVFSPGYYRISAGLTITDSNIRLVGSGMSNESSYTDGTTIMATGAANFTLVTFGAAGSQIYGGGMKDIHLWGGATYTLTGGLALVNLIEGVFENCRIDLRNADASGRCAVSIDAAAGGSCRLNRFLNCSFQNPKTTAGPANTAGYGVRISRSAGTSNRYNSFEGCWFYNESAVATAPPPAGFCLETKDTSVGRNFFSNCNFGFLNEQGINLTGGDGNDCFVNCFVDSGNAADDAILIAAGTENCYFIGSTIGLIVDSCAEADKAYIINLADANGPQFKALTVQARSAAPVAPVEGTLYYDAEDHKLYVWTGAAWTDLTV